MNDQDFIDTANEYFLNELNLEYSDPKFRLGTIIIQRFLNQHINSSRYSFGINKFIFVHYTCIILFYYMIFKKEKMLFFLLIQEDCLKTYIIVH